MWQGSLAPAFLSLTSAGWRLGSLYAMKTSFQGLKFIISVLSFFQPAASQGAEDRIQLAASRKLQECPHGVPWSPLACIDCTHSILSSNLGRGTGHSARWATGLESYCEEGLGLCAPQAWQMSYCTAGTLSSSGGQSP